MLGFRLEKLKLKLEDQPVNRCGFRRRGDDMILRLVCSCDRFSLEQVILPIVKSVFPEAVEVPSRNSTGRTVINLKVEEDAS